MLLPQKLARESSKGLFSYKDFFQHFNSKDLFGHSGSSQCSMTKKTLFFNLCTPATADDTLHNLRKMFNKMGGVYVI